jgi:hypothetical protein
MKIKTIHQPELLYSLYVEAIESKADLKEAK